MESDQEVIEIPEDEESISLDGEAFKEMENMDTSADKEKKETEGEVKLNVETEKKDSVQKKDISTRDDFDDEELDSEAEDTGEGAEDLEQEMMNMPPLSCVMAELGHLKQGRRVIAHPLRISELSHPKVLETISQDSCEEVKLHFVRPQSDPQGMSGFLLLHFCSTKAARQAVENLKSVRDDLDIKSDDLAAFANQTMELWIRDEKGQKRWTDTMLWIKNISEDVTEDQLNDVFHDAEDIVMRGSDKNKDKKKDKERQKEKEEDKEKEDKEEEDKEKKTKEAYVLYRTKESALEAAKEYATQTIELDGEPLKIYKYHVPQDQMPRGFMKLKERRVVLKYMKLLTNQIDQSKEEGSEIKLPEWSSKRLEICKILIERDNRARKQLGLPTPELDELQAMTGIKVYTGSERKDVLINLGVLDRPRRSYQRESRDSGRDSRDRKRSYDSRSSSRNSRNSGGSLLGIPPSLTSLNAIPSMAMLMQQNLMGNMMRQQAAMMGMGGFGGAGGGQMAHIEPQRKMLRLDESGSFHVDYDRGYKGDRDSKGGSGRSSKPTSLLDL